MFPLPMHMYVELAAWLISLLCWRALTTTQLIWFVPYLTFIVLVELTARYLYHELQQPNAWLYSFSVPIEYSMYIFALASVYTRKIFSVLALFVLGWLLTYCIYSVIFVTGLTRVNSNIFVAGSTVCSFFAILSFYELYQQTNERGFFTLPMFWITVGILLFNAGEISLNIYTSFASEHGMRNMVSIFAFINHNLINVLYSSFIIAFLCQKIYGTSRRASAVT